jgi:hypothetical protein
MSTTDNPYVSRTVLQSLLEVTEIAARVFQLPEGEMADAISSALLQKTDVNIYDCSGTGLSIRIDSDEERGGVALDFFNSHWWETADRHEIRTKWRKYGIRHTDVMDILRCAAKLAGLQETSRDTVLIMEEALTNTERRALAKGTEANATYLDQSHPRYSPKLAAAVRAWLAVDDPKGKSPKQALESWLTAHASEFALTKEDGTPNTQGIDECAKVANWNPKGGAPKTPGS